MRPGPTQLARQDEARQGVWAMPLPDKGAEYLKVVGAGRCADVDLLSGTGYIAEKDEAGPHAARPTG